MNRRRLTERRLALSNGRYVGANGCRRERMSARSRATVGFDAVALRSRLSRMSQGQTKFHQSNDGVLAPLGGDRRLKLRDFLTAHDMNYPAQFLDFASEPSQFFLTDGIMFGIARLYVGVLQLFEHRSLGPCAARPYVKQAEIEPLGLGSQEAQVVDVWCIKSAHEKRCMVHSFGGLVKIKDSFFRFASGYRVLKSIIEI